MANYYNPYNFYQQPVAPQVPQYTSGNYLGQTSYSAPQVKAIEWVEGEIGAKAYQIPAGWPANNPIALWDSTDTVIYLKSINQNGIPNPLQKLHYTIEEQQSPLLMSGATQSSAQSGVDMSNYVTKDDLEQLRQEIAKLNEANNQRNQNRNNNGNNRG